MKPQTRIEEARDIYEIADRLEAINRDLQGEALQCICQGKDEPASCARQRAEGVRVALAVVREYVRLPQNGGPTQAAPAI